MNKLRVECLLAWLADRKIKGKVMPASSHNNKVKNNESKHLN